MGTQTQPAIPAYATGTNRQVTIPASTFTPSDLRRLYKLLESKATEAAERQVALLTQQQGQSQTQFEQFKATVRSAMAVVVRVQTKGGGWTGATSMQPLEDEQLPDGVIKIEFDSAALYRSRFNNLLPNNHFLVAIDFVRPSILDMNPQPVPNTSTATVSGLDLTWANGLCDELIAFFRQTASRRGWLHFPESYTMLLILLGFPLSFDIVYYLDKMVRRVGSLPQALSVAIYVYSVLVVLYGFRVLFNYARWVFPKIEMDAPRQHIGVKHRIAISTLAIMIIGALVKAALKLFGIG